jgi:hypothetical protein
MNAPAVALFLLAIHGHPDTLIASAPGTTLSALRVRIAGSLPRQHFLVMQIADGDWAVGRTNPRGSERVLPRHERRRHRGDRAFESCHVWRLATPGQLDRIVAITRRASLEAAQSRVRHLFADLGPVWALTPLEEGTWRVAVEGTVVFPSDTSLDEDGFAYGPIPRLPTPASNGAHDLVA